MGRMYDTSSCGSLRPGVLNLVIVGMIIIRSTLMRSGGNHKAFNLGFLFTALFCPQEQLKWKCHFVNEVQCFFFHLITISQAIECQKIIPGFSEFSVAHRCVAKDLCVSGSLKRRQRIRGRGSKDQVIDWNQRGKTSTPNSGGSVLPLSHLKVARILFSQHNVSIGGKSCLHFLTEKLVFSVQPCFGLMTLSVC